MGDIEDLARMSEEEQVMRAENTDNGPQSHEDALKTAHLPQEPGSVVNNYERYPGTT